MEASLGVKSFFMMDENFLLHKRRALELLERMKEHQKPWALYVFSSANAINQYSIRELVELGVSWIWMGLESPHSGYAKLKGQDTLSLAAELRQHGIKLLGSTIVGLEHHTPQNIQEELEHAVAHNTDFHQFMLYTPVPGTPLFHQMTEEGRMIPGVDLADIHGQHQFNFAHAAISREDSKRWLDWAFRRDFERNGPSIYRICRTTLEGWKRYKNDPDPRVRARFTWEARALSDGYARRSVGHGKAPAAHQSGRQPESARLAQGSRPRIRPDEPRGIPRTRPRPALVHPPRGKTAGRRPNLRARNHHRTPQLAGPVTALLSQQNPQRLDLAVVNIDLI